MGRAVHVLAGSQAGRSGTTRLAQHGGGVGSVLPPGVGLAFFERTRSAFAGSAASGLISRVRQCSVAACERRGARSPVRRPWRQWRR